MNTFASTSIEWASHSSTNRGLQLPWGKTSVMFLHSSAKFSSGAWLWSYNIPSSPIRWTSWSTIRRRRSSSGTLDWIRKCVGQFEETGHPGYASRPQTVTIRYPKTGVDWKRPSAYQVSIDILAQEATTHMYCWCYWSHCCCRGFVFFAVVCFFIVPKGAFANC